jgi:hypothetical protein
MLRKNTSKLIETASKHLKIAKNTMIIHKNQQYNECWMISKSSKIHLPTIPEERPKQRFANVKQSRSIKEGQECR